MKGPRWGIWRSLRCGFILFCVGSAVIAADNSWMTALPLEEFSLDEWYDSLVGTESREAKVKSPDEPARVAETQTSISRWTNRSIFYQASNGWMLDTARSAGLPLSKTQSYSAPTAFAQLISSPYSAAPSSSDLVRYSTAASILVPNAPTASGNWTSNATGIWGSASNWQGGVIADGAGNTAHFDTLDITTPVTVLLDTSRTIGNLFIGDTNGTDRYTISPTSSTLTFDDNSSSFSVHSILQQTSTSAGDTIDVSVLVKNDLDINNLSAAHQFTISGNIASSAASGSGQLLWFNNHNVTSNAAGNILVSGNISDGTTNATLTLVVVNGGTVTLSGTNTYTGYTEVEAGTLLVNGTNSGANSVYVDNAGTLGGHGTIAGNVYTFGGKITGDTTTTVGTLTLQGNVVLNTGEGAGGTYLANLAGSTSDLLAITGQLVLGLGTTLDIDGTANGTTTYILATFASHTGVFQNVMDIPSGYTLVYNATDIELVPTAIPEPATWIGGALALGAIAFVSRKRLRFHRA